MKSVFSEYYKISKSEEKRIWTEGLIVVDNNILLNQYRYSKTTSDKVIEVLTKLKDRLWIPYQVGLEYHNNRLDCFYNSWNASKTIKEKVDETRKHLLDDIKNKFNRNPFVVIEEFEDVVNKSFRQIEDKLKEWDKSVTDFINEDPINKKIIKLFENRIGADFTKEEIEKIYKEGEKRYSEKVPPGYKDDTQEKRSQGKRNVYGDLILWKQMMLKAKEEDKDVVFISDDEKEDWWFEWKGRKIYPRVELIREFRNETGHRILFYNQKAFLEYANNNLSLGQLDDTIKEVETDIRKKFAAQERYIRESQKAFESFKRVYDSYMDKANVRLDLDPADLYVGTASESAKSYMIRNALAHGIYPDSSYIDYLDRMKTINSSLTSRYLDGVMGENDKNPGEMTVRDIMNMDKGGKK